MRGSLHCATDDETVRRFGRDDASVWVRKKAQLEFKRKHLFGFKKKHSVSSKESLCLGSRKARLEFKRKPLFGFTRKRCLGSAQLGFKESTAKNNRNENSGC
jgi:hypothetical protein